MDKSLIAIILMYILRSTMGDAGVCLSGWHYNSKANKCYKLYQDKQTFTQAQASCQNKGAVLAMPKTRLETETVYDIRHQNPEPYVWIGANDSKAEGDWKWNDGDAVDGWINWYNDEPNDGELVKGEDCMVVGKHGKWFDGPCDWRLYFICEMTVPEEPVLSMTPVGQNVEPFTEIKLNCSLKSQGPIMTYKFYHDNKLIIHSSDSVKTLPSVEFKDSGTYTCQAFLSNGLVSTKSTILDIHVNEIPVCSTNTTSRSIEPGSTLEFICTVRTKLPGMSYTFYYKGNMFRSGASHVIRKRNLEFANSGAYTCDVLYNGRRSVMSARHVIIVPGCPVPEGDDEYMQRILSSITPREETTRWGPAQNKGPAKRHQEQEENLDHDEF